MRSCWYLVWSMPSFRGSRSRVLAAVSLLVRIAWWWRDGITRRLQANRSLPRMIQRTRDDVSGGCASCHPWVKRDVWVKNALEWVWDGVKLWSDVWWSVALGWSLLGRLDAQPHWWPPTPFRWSLPLVGRECCPQSNFHSHTPMRSDRRLAFMAWSFCWSDAACNWDFLADRRMVSAWSRVSASPSLRILMRTVLSATPEINWPNMRVGSHKT